MEFTRGDGDNIGTASGGAWWGSMWVFALVILALFFLWGKKDDRRDHYGDGVLPALAMGGMMKNSGHCVEEKIWDVERDQMREFANLRDEVKDVGWRQSAETAKYFYEQRGAMDKGFFEQARLIDRNNYDTALGFKQSEIGNLVQTKEILARIDRMENDMKDKEIEQLTSKVNLLETIQGIRGWGVPASYPATPPAYC